MKKLNLFLLIGLFGSLDLFAMSPSEGVGASSIEEVVSQEEAEECSICAEKLEENNLLSPYLCKHGFHKDCIEGWFEQPGGGLCPYCRAEKKPAPVEVQPRASRDNRRLKELNRQLLVSVRNGNLEFVNRLLERGANVNAADIYDQGATALILAAKNGYLNVVNILLEAGANVNTSDNHNYTALAYAAIYGRLNVVNRLLEIDGIEYSRALIPGSGSGNLEIVNRLIEAGADVNYVDERGHTALKRATRDLEIVNRLLEAGAEVNLGKSVLRSAAINGNLGVVNRLLRAGANANDTDSSGDTPLMRAARFGHLSIVNRLLEAGANVNAISDRGDTALREAITTNHPDVIAVLQEAGAIE